MVARIGLSSPVVKRHRNARTESPVNLQGWDSFPSPSDRPGTGRPAPCLSLERDLRDTFSTHNLGRGSVLHLGARRWLWKHPVTLHPVIRRTQQHRPERVPDQGEAGS